MTIATALPILDGLVPSHTHPLDPLSTSELHEAVNLLRDNQQLGASWRFAIAELHEPAKDAVLAAAVDKAPERRPERSAFFVVFNSSTGETYEAIVSLTERAVKGWVRIPLDAAPFGQPPVLLEDFMNADRIVKQDAGWREALKRRGLTEEDIERVQVDPFSAGYYDTEAEHGKRIVRAVCYYREDKKDNAYAHPIEGVVAVVDLIAGRVMELVDDEMVIPIPKKKRNYETGGTGPGALPPPRQGLKPLNITQPAGPSFSVDGWQVKWQNWEFRLGFTQREGIVLHQVGYQDSGRVRPILYRASVSEMVVPYADPTTNHYWKNAFDAGEYGLGRLANALELGCDCLGLIRYFDIPTVDDHGQPMLMKNAVCMHEEDYGVAWKHFDFRTGIHEVRRSRRLVVSFFATVGNYDYGFYWYLYQDGTIQLEVKLTGIIQTAAIVPGKPYPYGGMVDEGLGGPTHQHFFSARLHMMVDGELNSVTEHEYQPQPWGTANPYGNVFGVASRVLSNELEACREADGRTGRYWKIINPSLKNGLGSHPGYKLVVQPTPLLLAQEGSSIYKRGGFATKHVWVTQYAPHERYAAGDYPNQHAGGDGLPSYVQQNRSIENQDIVVWHTIGHTHVCKPEDFPIMPVEYAGFMLKPNNFFAANPAIDVPAERNSLSVEDGGGPGNHASGTCCSSGSNHG